MKTNFVTLVCAAILVCGAALCAPAQEQGTPRLKAYTTVKPLAVTPGVAAATAKDPLPHFTYTTTASRDGHTYSGVMIGTDPFVSGAGVANVTAQVIPLIIKTSLVGTNVDFGSGVITTEPGSTTLDPTVPNTACLSAPNNVPLGVYRQSPLFQAASFSFGGTFVGKTQYADAFQRANFWNTVSTIAPNHHTELNPVVTLAPIVINVPTADGLALATTSLGPPAFCAPMGIIDFSWFDNLVTSTILPQLATQGVNGSTLPIFLFSNVVLASPVTNIFTCCVLGYHGANQLPFQTYAPMDFDSTGLFGPSIENTSIAAHEIDEWMNDPLGNNQVPPWGHIGQQPGCQSNLEVGDPLTGTDIPPVTMPNGFAYNLQELVFFSWFYGAPSIAVNGWFSDNNTFTTDAGPPCH